MHCSYSLLKYVLYISINTINQHSVLELTKCRQHSIRAIRKLCIINETKSLTKTSLKLVRCLQLYEESH